MFRLRVWDTSFCEVGVVERLSASTLLDIGKTLQKIFGAYYRLEVVE